MPRPFEGDAPSVAPYDFGDLDEVLQNLPGFLPANLKLFSILVPIGVYTHMLPRRPWVTWNAAEHFRYNSWLLQLCDQDVDGLVVGAVEEAGGESDANFSI